MDALGSEGVRHYKFVIAASGKRGREIVCLLLLGLAINCKHKAHVVNCGSCIIVDGSRQPCLLVDQRRLLKLLVH